MVVYFYLHTAFFVMVETTNNSYFVFLGREKEKQTENCIEKAEEVWLTGNKLPILKIPTSLFGWIMYKMKLRTIKVKL